MIDPANRRFRALVFCAIEGMGSPSIARARLGATSLRHSQCGRSLTS